MDRRESPLRAEEVSCCGHQAREEHGLRWLGGGHGPSADLTYAI